jgi:hypothetical protein
MARSSLLRALVVAGLSLVAGLALAQDKAVAQDKVGGDKVVQEADRTIYQKRTVIDFSDVAVEGELSRPEGSYSVSKRRTTFRTLVKVRDSLAPELQKSAENL